MPPKKYNALPNAVRLFRCDLCAKDYSRQPDYEAHLRSYDHTHRTRMADMKRLTAQNEDKLKGSSKDKGDLRTVDTGKTGGPKFTKIGAAGEGVSRFKKVGTAVGGETKPGFTKVRGPNAPADTNTPKSVEKKEEGVDEDVVMGDARAEGEEDEEEYDFTKPTGCDHATCPGCKLAAEHKESTKSRLER
ncbi:hypothetical protein BDV96DRAFT_177435 [Lophiotrema nucula]|uniref:C2H2-type domain-containing protein n=1 Tax=Lophiotrema nucula TaxID=690887 RepID=A0A6A5YX91_9PLEO|nr:hypothetical protein BDV96DRAFT_177435 [Lophiotrema nucula]